jgi:hypothetical protein
MTDRIEKARQLLREALEQYGDQFDDMIPDVQQAIMDEIEGLTREELGVAVREELKEAKRQTCAHRLMTTADSGT